MTIGFHGITYSSFRFSLTVKPSDYPAQIRYA
jgi:hypothetical protein